MKHLFGKPVLGITLIQGNSGIARGHYDIPAFFEHGSGFFQVFYDYQNIDNGFSLNAFNRAATDMVILGIGR